MERNFCLPSDTGNFDTETVIARIGVRMTEAALLNMLDLQGNFCITIEHELILVYFRPGETEALCTSDYLKATCLGRIFECED